MKKRVLALLSAGHAFTDINSGALPMILTFLQPVLMLSQFQVGEVMLAFNISSSVIQPAFGILSDRLRAAWLIPVGCLMAGLGLAFTGFSLNFTFLMSASLISGLGVAAYHPEGSKYARFASGSRKASGMSLFAVGGNLGFAAGSVLAAFFFVLAGLKGTVGFIALNGIMALFLWIFFPEITSTQVVCHESSTTKPKGQIAKNSGKVISLKIAAPLVLLVAVIVMRTWIHFGMVTFLPQYYIHYLHYSSTYTAALVTIYLLSGAIGTFVGGPVADRWGLKNVIVLSMVLMIPLLLFFPYSKGIWTIVVMALAGFVLISTFALTVVFAQELLPNNVGLASGLTLGLAIGMGGVGAAFLGWVADNWGLPSIFKVMTFFPLIGLLLASFLPGKGKLSQIKLL